ncbi:hypothetical protein MCOR27_008394 [Pyricularia oryzae]|uniref:RING-type domain-containing protein n=2 Tax=Pyricularia TaxID=48558 RepID=A0ABQ8NA61_PYRGI|nr:hypothetical protein MCOR01_009978 [Pyricularia oryzae]KAI6293805.1 hypothetical protein MCOR33_008877 [Pyricularia grisea]KAI6258978.1 hypothetical protein MCOR19_004632 [Pyricularia oryzae]KAI6272329.1 hypothetical protein MCOR27_008394 [Pyricularia oryzae]KAI6272355.1 hypothetical protein MCOR26_007397 [Pyricularia oryzae]
MRPPRVVILVFFFSAALFLFCRSITSFAQRKGESEGSIASPIPEQPPAKSKLRSFFSLSTPFSLFPPNAIISLTDDNSTSFQARPAAFGPQLPHKGLSGQLWIGSGFADDNLPEGEGEGELGCSDVPGWEDGAAGLAALAGMKPIKKGGFTKSTKLGAGDIKSSKNSKRDVGNLGGPAVNRKTKSNSRDDAKKNRPFDDGTDDYLHQGFQRSSPLRGDKSQSHSDIQSMQETAEITGKVVLLSRGGCGFLEKVKWAQRRGAVGVIVGDNTKGGPLIQMFARGDTSNVTIPAIFTSRTTAHILSSLMQPGSFIEDIIDEKGKAVVKVQQTEKGRKTRHQANKAEVVKKELPRKDVPKATTTTAPTSPAKSRGWLSSFFRWSADVETVEKTNSRDWVLVDDWSDEKDTQIRASMEKAAKKGQDGLGNTLDNSNSDAQGQHSDSKSGTGKDKDKSFKEATLTTGVTPSSGQYAPEVAKHGKLKGKMSNKADSSSAASHGSFVGSMFRGEKSGNSKAEENMAAETPDGADLPEHREGLWVTITPTASGSPFFDTLLVLVVSPLITLSVVYALLILRAKLRRRRWRAPKSVVERLPVRTYHTVASSSNPSRLPSPTSSSPTTPLLQQQQQVQPSTTTLHVASSSPSSSRSRPRSRTTNDVPDSSDGMLRVDPDLQTPRTPSRTSRRKSPPQLSSEWKKYMSRQVECVVCLEEYVDGVSRVMSLPCGHEFHVECITPWLTTRRRTCPICKGDVVRSLARGSPTSPRYDPYDEESDDEGEVLASTSDDSRPASPTHDHDVERGILSSPSRSSGRGSGRSGRGGLFGLISTTWTTLRSASRTDSERNNRDDRRIR